MTGSTDARGHRPEGRWAFDDEVTRVFDDMLRRSIPELPTMRSLVFEVGQRFVRPDTCVVDLGCSRGDSVAPFMKTFGSTVHFVGVEVSPHMLSAARARFEEEVEAGTFELLDLDLSRTYPDAKASLTLAVLTLQFIPLEHRLRVVQEVYDRTLPGGAFILVEKVLGSSAPVDAILTDLYEDLKRRKKTYDERPSAPVASEIEALLREVAEIGVEVKDIESGLIDFRTDRNGEEVYLCWRLGECFWRSLNFAGWVAVKRESAPG